MINYGSLSLKPLINSQRVVIKGKKYKIERLFCNNEHSYNFICIDENGDSVVNKSPEEVMELIKNKTINIL